METMILKVEKFVKEFVKGMNVGGLNLMNNPYAAA